MTSEAFQNLSNVLVFAGIVLTGLGGYGQYHFGKKVEREKTAAETQLKEQAKAHAAVLTFTAAEVERRRRVIGQLRALYLASHDGISSEMMTGLAPLPKTWTEDQLSRQGETWRQDEYR